jgi:beta-N-acetylhexosaminidase
MNENLGPVMLDLAGPEVSAGEGELLRHPLVGGVILFSRNFRSPQQLGELTASIRALRNPELLIAVDHEGGRVQRFQEGFTRIPAMRRLGDAWDRDRGQACAAAGNIAYVLASELLACGVDFSFTPVLDVDFGASGVIGDRAFHSEPAAIAQLSAALIAGLRAAGMASVGKHFPGHGYVHADSHHAVPVDERSYAEIEAVDLVPYRELIRHGLSAVMPAHVIYPKVDALPAGFSSKWLRQILRGALGFDGMIFSDDLSMEGASVAGDVVERGRAALAAGCDMVLLCNAPEAASNLLDGLSGTLDARRANAMRGDHSLPDLQTRTALEAAKDALIRFVTDAG